MALTSVGFPGQVSAVEDAIRSKFQGANYPVVADLADYAVTINNVSDRTVNIATGVAWAHGVYVTNSATATVQLDTVATSGQTRWDAIVLRRNWASSGSVSLTKVNGTAALNAPLVVPTLNDNPGVLHDQLLAMAQVTNGQLSVTSVDPRRGWASKLFLFPSLNALPVAAAVPYGTSARLVSGSEYRRLQDASSNPAWIGTGTGGQTELTGAAVITAATGWTVAGLSNRALIDAATGEVQLDLNIRRTGTTITANVDHGNFTDALIATMSAACVPDVTIPCMFQYAGDPGFVWSGATGRLDPNGQFLLETGAPGLDVYARTGGTDVSVRASVRFARKVT